LSDRAATGSTTSQIDALAVGNLAADQHLRDHRVTIGLAHLHADLAVIDENGRPFGQGTEDFGMRQANPAGIPRCLVEIEAKALSHAQLMGRIRKDAASDLRPLKVSEDADGTAQLMLDLADQFVAVTLILLRPGAHVQAKDIHARLEQRADHRPV
jgi:hypothetical protein